MGPLGGLDDPALSLDVVLTRRDGSAEGTSFYGDPGTIAQNPVTARAAVLLQDLDREIRRRTDDRRDLDDVVRKLMRIGKV